MKKNRRLIITTLALISIMGTVAFGGTAVSTAKTFTVQNETYKNTATIDAYPELAQSTVWVSGTKKLPAGYFGVNASIVKDGTVIETTTTDYNDSAVKGLGKATSIRTGVAGSTYCAYGVTKVFNGTSYVSKETNMSPNQTVSGSRTGEKAITDEKGQYDFNEIIEKDQMVPAIGVDGVEGYIYPRDSIDMEVKTPEQALAKQKHRTAESEYINLYAEDGKTVIGKMELSRGITLTK